jgi:hypothetical protein
MYVANFLWDKLREHQQGQPTQNISRFDSLFSELTQHNEAIRAAPPMSEAKSRAYKSAELWRNHNRDLRQSLFSTYWLNITDKKEQRKICKRGTMTLALTLAQVKGG